MSDDLEATPVLDTIVAMTAASVERCDLGADELLLVRIAALAAVRRPPHLPTSHTSGRAVEVGLDPG